MEYTGRLRKLKVLTLKYRRLRGDMFETFKIMAGIHDVRVTEGFLIQDGNTRTKGHSKILKKKTCPLNLRTYSFTNRIVDVWKSLPNDVVNAKVVKKFEIRLHKYWEHQDVKYDFKAGISINLTANTEVTESLAEWTIS